MSQESKSVSVSFGVGNAVATVVSWVHWHSFGWAAIHFLCGWFYVLYYVIRYGLR